MKINTLPIYPNCGVFDTVEAQSSRMCVSHRWFEDHFLNEVVIYDSP